MMTKRAPRPPPAPWRTTPSGSTAAPTAWPGGVSSGSAGAASHRRQPNGPSCSCPRSRLGCRGPHRRPARPAPARRGASADRPRRAHRRRGRRPQRRRDGGARRPPIRRLGRPHHQRHRRDHRPVDRRGRLLCEPAAEGPVDQAFRTMPRLAVTSVNAAIEAGFSFRLKLVSACTERTWRRQRHGGGAIPNVPAGRTHRGRWATIDGPHSPEDAARRSLAGGSGLGLGPATDRRDDRPLPPAGRRRPAPADRPAGSGRPKGGGFTRPTGRSGRVDQGYKPVERVLGRGDWRVRSDLAMQIEKPAGELRLRHLLVDPETCAGGGSSPTRHAGRAQPTTMIGPFRGDGGPPRRWAPTDGPWPVTVLPALAAAQPLAARLVGPPAAVALQALIDWNYQQREIERSTQVRSIGCARLFSMHADKGLKRLSRTLLGIFALCLWLFFILRTVPSGANLMIDFTQYYDASRALLNDTSPYHASVRENSPAAYLLPPIFAIVIMPWASASQVETANVAWYFLSMAFLAAGCAAVLVLTNRLTNRLLLMRRMRAAAFSSIAITAFTFLPVWTSSNSARSPRCSFAFWSWVDLHCALPDNRPWAGSNRRGSGIGA